MDEHQGFALSTPPTVDDATGHLLLAAAGELDLASAGELRLILLRALREHTVVLEMRELTFCDSAGLRTVIEAHRHAQKYGTALRIAAPSAALTRVFDLAGATGIIATYPDVASALAAG
ncbi:STAS domain-containing protein [Actinospica robiniae]|uniref:STAS domain-containing protein n=1 Tax=Actinospica robiniae TaxID=304901 RepID=UPI0006859336|nr:STAS domain-containing protein [Actinospica robiniae]